MSTFKIEQLRLKFPKKLRTMRLGQNSLVLIKKRVVVKNVPNVLFTVIEVFKIYFH